MKEVSLFLGMSSSHFFFGSCSGEGRNDVIWLLVELGRALFATFVRPPGDASERDEEGKNGKVQRDPTKNRKTDECGNIARESFSSSFSFEVKRKGKWIEPLKLILNRFTVECL